MTPPTRPGEPDAGDLREAERLARLRTIQALCKVELLLSSLPDKMPSMGDLTEALTVVRTALNGTI